MKNYKLLPLSCVQTNPTGCCYSEESPTSDKKPKEPAGIEPATLGIIIKQANPRISYP